MMQPQTDDGGKGKRRVAVDFDGVIHAYSRGWADGSIYDGPVPGAMQALAELQGLGLEVVVYTSRHTADIADWISAQAAYARVNLGPIEITNLKPIASVYIDDRAVRFTDWERALATTAYLLGLDREPGRPALERQPISDVLVVRGWNNNVDEVDDFATLAQMLGKPVFLLRGDQSVASESAETLARMFHEAREALAPEWGYRESTLPWDEVPEHERNLMIATVAAVLRQLGEPNPEPAGTIHG
jgi:hypothetical protein